MRWRSLLLDDRQGLDLAPAMLPERPLPTQRMSEPGQGEEEHAPIDPSTMR